MINQVKSKRSRVKIRVGFNSFFTFLLLTFCFALSQPAAAQDDPPDTAPPPLKIISKEERQRLDAKRDIKERTSLALEMMNTRLGTAEKHTATEDFDAMFRELGFFHALVDDSVSFLEKRDASSKKVLDTLKKLEIGLRSFIPRLETVRRELPSRYEDYVRQLMKFVRDARTRAIDPMFGDSVVKTRTER